jgi:hypothetical protein
MARVKQLTIAAENRPGTLAQVAKTLADAKVNIVALLSSTAGAQGTVQVVVDNVNKAQKALGGAASPTPRARWSSLNWQTSPPHWRSWPGS